MKPSREERAWQAGIIDGEGTVTISRQIRKGRPSPAFRCYVQVTNTNRRLVNPFKKHWGGEIYHRPDKRKHKNWKASYTWHCPQTKVVPCLTALLPYLRGKNKQAVFLIEFDLRKKSFPRYKGSTQGGKRGGSLPLGVREIAFRQRLWNQVRALNTKGTYARSQKGE